jgi:hypothetical protein
MRISKNIRHAMPCHEVGEFLWACYIAYFVTMIAPHDANLAV